MIRQPSALRRRLTWALTGLTIASAMLVGLALWSSDTYIEDAAVRDLMERELTSLVGVDPSGTVEGSSHDTLRYYRGDQIPPELIGLGPGFHEEVAIDEREFHVLVREIGPNNLAYLAYDISFVEHREFALGLATTLVLLIVALGAAALAGRIADRTLRPLDALAAQVLNLDPERRGVRLKLDNLDNELGVFVNAINTYMQELDALVERERAFAAAASHELRTPLAVIQGAAETLQLSTDTPALARIRRAVGDARHELDALLALSRVRETPVHESLELVTFLKSVAEPYITGGTAVRVQWDTPEAMQIEAPQGAVSVIFSNLLRNALRASRDGTVRVRVRERCIAVIDDGPGIPDDELQHVFEPRFRGRDGGSGMGLYIARVLAQRLGWRLELSNRADGRGACARMHLSPDVHRLTGTAGDLTPR
ncbi:HAMP domain-containing histidine kinase [Sinimarinibacterium sp. CAU 1509]|uniref:sensor histidine kinase n=1 Tax=Sinimarinibacterium sp. CAU 1509 TaxID=2562283 RepID=UPI0010AD8341|nr:HAMP domain-containing sensor histidine kinase [Sinimarinibacterium sp. CAU 1509]TJY58267.1 HAMP domain-containing histidine kinase [Sinimarinibacterium sp. CAU 1509]